MRDRDAERQASRIAHLRSRYITASENVHRLANRGAPPEQVAAAEANRDRAGDAWNRAWVEANREEYREKQRKEAEDAQDAERVRP
jgi:hypothetical protein